MRQGPAGRVWGAGCQSPPPGRWGGPLENPPQPPTPAAGQLPEAKSRSATQQGGVASRPCPHFQGPPSQAATHFVWVQQLLHLNLALLLPT